MKELKNKKEIKNQIIDINWKENIVWNVMWASNRRKWNGFLKIFWQILALSFHKPHQVWRQSCHCVTINSYLWENFAHITVTSCLKSCTLLWGSFFILHVFFMFYYSTFMCQNWSSSILIVFLTVYAVYA